MAVKPSKAHKPEDMLIRIIRVAEILAKSDCSSAQSTNPVKPGDLRDDEHIYRSQKHSNNNSV